MADEDRTALLDGIEGDLAGVDRALARLETGTYFSCEVCGATLDDALLAVDPAQARCVACTALAVPATPVPAGDEPIEPSASGGPA
jgi:RNA polymerase-binding transcription factor DksA